MKRSEIKVLIVEDDQNMGNALKEGFVRSGFKAQWCQSPDQAMNSFRVSEYQLVVMDCMLPKISGIELATQMRKFAGNGFKLIFTSGIFKDKSFSQSAISQTDADAFITKPFDLGDFLKQAEALFTNEIEKEKPPVIELMKSENVSFSEVSQAIEDQNSFHGFDLLWIYSLLHRSHYSGQLHVMSQIQPPFSVLFHKGKITNIQMPDVESYFGVLLVEMGFTSIDEVEESLKSQKGKPLGQLLIDANALSPHAIQIVLTEQLAIRVSKSIQNHPVELRLSSEPTQDESSSLGSHEMSQAMHDWVSSKLSYQWLSDFYLQWLDAPVKITSDIQHISERKHLPLFEDNSGWLAKIDGKKSLQDLLATEPDKELERLQALHFGILEGIFYFDPSRPSTVNFQCLKRRLEGINKGFADKNYFEWLGLTPSATSKEISKSYLEMAKNFHPDKLPLDCPAEITDLAKKVFAKVTEAYDLLKSDEERKNYKNELEQGSASDNLKAEMQFEQALSLVGRGQYKEAEELLEKMKKYKVFVGQIRIHLIWSKIKAHNQRSFSTVQLNEIKMLLSQIPPEDRHCAPFFYVKALYAKGMGDYKKAHNFFRNAIAVDPSMADAKRDLAILVKELELQRKSSGDWSNMVSRMFKAK